MSVEQNKAIIRRWIDVWNTGELEPLEEIIAPDYVRHGEGTTLRPESGPEWYKQQIAGARRAMPDFHVTTEDLIAEGDRVVGRWSWGGTREGQATTPWGATVESAGKQVKRTAITITRLADGKIAEEWWQLDRLEEWQQLGAIP
jgi:predicted ester cyclase